MFSLLLDCCLGIVACWYLFICCGLNCLVLVLRLVGLTIGGALWCICALCVLMFDLFAYWWFELVLGIGGLPLFLWVWCCWFWVLYLLFVRLEFFCRLLFTLQFTWFGVLPLFDCFSCFVGCRLDGLLTVFCVCFYWFCCLTVAACCCFVLFGLLEEFVNYLCVVFIVVCGMLVLFSFTCVGYMIF